MNRQGRVLIVDDLRKWREPLVEILQRDGFDVDAVATETEALQRLDKALYHLLILDIRLVDPDPSNVGGIDLLRRLDERGLSEATKVIMLSAYGTQEQMRLAFKDYKVADFLAKDQFTTRTFLESVRRVFSEEININLALQILWKQINGPEQAIINLVDDETSINSGTDLQKRLATELEDLLCRLFYQAKSVLVRPLAHGHSGTGVLWVQPFYTTGGSGHEVIVKFGDFNKVEEEYRNFKKYVQPFLGSGRNTTVLDVRRTARLGGIIYSLLGTGTDQLVEFGEFYRRANISQIKDALDRLFWDTCGAWYASPGHIQPLDLAADYQQSLEYTPKRLEQVLFNQLKAVQGRQNLHFKNLKGERTFTNPILATTGISFVRPTYLCITHGDFNQNNLLVDSTGHMWMIDFQGISQSHILRDISTLDSVVRFQLLAAEEATLQERLQIEEALCSIKRFSQVEQLMNRFSTTNSALSKAYATVVHLRKVARRLVERNASDDISEYYIALLYNAMNTLRFSSLSQVQREHALLCASLLTDRLGLSS